MASYHHPAVAHAGGEGRALILAAGSGNRMRPLTWNTHRVLWPIAGRTVRPRAVDSLPENGVDRCGGEHGFLRAAVRHHEENTQFARALAESINNRPDRRAD